MPAFMMAAMDSRLIMSSASNHPWLTTMDPRWPIDARFHLADGLGQADEDGAADDAVADVELFHLRRRATGPTF